LRSLRKREQGQEALDRRFVALDFHIPGAQGLGELAPAVHQCGQRVRAGREDGVGFVRGAARELEPATSDLGAETVVAQSQFDARLEPGGGFGVEHRAEREHECIDADGGALRKVGRPGGPAAERHDGGLELQAPAGQLVHPGAGRRRELAPAHDRRPLQLLQPLGENVRTDAGQAGAQAGEALGAEHQLAHDEEGPALTDQVEGMRRRASVVVAAFACFA